mmetsp:Transcript_5604/g.17934  ORF Transcript_5604/g.17934 Transcript_5604/m.17934 type:complete len:141 (+) Transcript_5604:1211-1633(+)
MFRWVGSTVTVVLFEAQPHHGRGLGVAPSTRMQLRGSKTKPKITNEPAGARGKRDKCLLLQTRGGTWPPGWKWAPRRTACAGALALVPAFEPPRCRFPLLGNLAFLARWRLDLRPRSLCSLLAFALASSLCFLLICSQSQ